MQNENDEVEQALAINTLAFQEEKARLRELESQLEANAFARGLVRKLEGLFSESLPCLFEEELRRLDASSIAISSNIDRKKLALLPIQRLLEHSLGEFNSKKHRSDALNTTATTISADNSPATPPEHPSALEGSDSINEISDTETQSSFDRWVKIGSFTWELISSVTQCCGMEMILKGASMTDVDTAVGRYICSRGCGKGYQIRFACPVLVNTVKPPKRNIHLSVFRSQGSRVSELTVWKKKS